MANIRAFLKRKDIVFSAKRYGIDALGAMAQGLFCTLLVGTILNTLGQMGVGFLNEIVVTVKQGENTLSYTIGGLASAMVGPGMAVAIGYALHCPPLVLFSLIPVGFAANAIGGAGGPLAVYAIAIAASGSAPWPCGACRQVLNEFAPEIRVIVTWDGHVEEMPLSGLLPHGFGPKSLE